MEIISNPIENWLDGLETLGLITHKKINSLLEVDNNKRKILEKLNRNFGLPIIEYFVVDGKNFNVSDSEIKNFLKSGELFAFRAIPKSLTYNLIHVRKHGITKEECIDSIKKLPGGVDKYVIELNVYFETEYGGTIINDGKRVFIELVSEDHFKLSQHDLPKDRLFKGFLNENGQISFNRDDKDLQYIVHSALNFLEKKDKRSSNGFLFGYFEFLYNKKRGYVFISYNDTELFTNLRKYEIKPEYSVKGLLRGNVVCSGKASGQVSIIKNFQEFDKFKDGNILVTKVITPDFLPLMEKSKAVVTDLGGITSHGAIITRELGIPCVFDTKEATKILKDGDLISIDAEGIDGVIDKM